MSWNHRVLFNEDDGMWYITEAYYSGSDEVDGYVAEGVQPVGETRDGLLQSVLHMLGAFEKPDLTHSRDSYEVKAAPPDDDQDGYSAAFWNMCEVLALAEDWLRMDHDNWTHYQRAKRELTQEFVRRRTQGE